MKQRITTFVACGVLALALFGGVMAGPFEDGLAAYQKGNYAAAMSYWRPLAEEGHATAQGNLGEMYRLGQGVPQDYAQAFVWYRKAAEQGDAGAQGDLGVMYSNGDGVPQDHVLAYMWFSLAGSRALDAGVRGMAVRGCDEVAAKMSPAQIAEAQRMAREWVPKK